MSVQVKVPTILRRHTGGDGVVQGTGSTVREVLQDLESRFPGFTSGVVTDGGALHRFVNVYVNEEDVRYLGALETGVEEGDVISILPAVAGGCALEPFARAEMRQAGSAASVHGLVGQDLAPDSRSRPPTEMPGFRH